MTTIQDMSLDERCDVAESYTDLIRQRLLKFYPAAKGSTQKRVVTRLDFPLAEEPIDASAVATAALDEITAVFSALQDKPKVGDVLCRQWVAEGKWILQVQTNYGVANG